MRFVLREPLNRERAASAVLAAGVGLQPPLCVEIKPYREPRNLEQNAAYWAAIHDVAQHVGYAPDDIHEIVKMKFLAPKEVELPDGSYRIVKSTTRLTKREMSDLIDQLHAWGASLGVEFSGAAYG